MSTALALTDDVNVITLRMRGDAPPAWSQLLGWPAIGADEVSFGGPHQRAREHAAAKLDGAVRLALKPVMLVAEGAACFATAWWARLTPEHEMTRVAGAVFFAPFGREADRARAAFASPNAPLPFPSLLLDPDNVPARRRELERLAREWGGSAVATPRMLSAPPRPASAWRQAQGLLSGYTARIVKRDIRLAHVRTR